MKCHCSYGCCPGPNEHVYEILSKPDKKKRQEFVMFWNGGVYSGHRGQYFYAVLNDNIERSRENGHSIRIVDRG